MRRTVRQGLDVLIVAFAFAVTTVFAAVSPAEPKAGNEAPIPEEVTITGHRFDADSLEHSILPAFVQSHSALSARTQQIGRWQVEVCPDTMGLEPEFEEYVSRRIKTIARGVGAPARDGLLQCKVNVQILFTDKAQEQLAQVAGTRPDRLGYSRESSKRRAVMNRPIQAWYITATHLDQIRGIDPGGFGESQTETDFGVIIGIASRLQDVRSDITSVLVIVDTTRLKGYSQRTLADYVAMLVLTRVRPDGCSELPSILDLLSDSCGQRDKPVSITDGDIAYLRALYSSHLSMRVNLERGELRDRMLKILTSTPDAVAVPSVVLDAHTGYYRFSGGALMAISRHAPLTGGNTAVLVAQVFGELPVPIVPRTSLEFAALVPSEQIRFVQDAKLETTGLVLRQDDGSTEAGRIAAAEVLAQVGAQREKIENQTPEPGGDSVLRALVDRLRDGTPDYSAMTPALASATRGQLRQLRRMISRLGDVVDLRFRGVDVQGYDIYDVSHRKGAKRWSLAFGRNGILVDAIVGDADVYWSRPSGADWRRKKLQ